MSEGELNDRARVARAMRKEEALLKNPVNRYWNDLRLEQREAPADG